MLGAIILLAFTHSPWPVQLKPLTAVGQDDVGAAVGGGEGTCVGQSLHCRHWYEGNALLLTVALPAEVDVPDEFGAGGVALPFLGALVYVQATGMMECGYLILGYGAGAFNLLNLVEPSVDLVLHWRSRRVSLPL